MMGAKRINEKYMGRYWEGFSPHRDLSSRAEQDGSGASHPAESRDPAFLGGSTCLIRSSPDY